MCILQLLFQTFQLIIPRTFNQLVTINNNRIEILIRWDGNTILIDGNPISVFLKVNTEVDIIHAYDLKLITILILPSI